MTLWHPLVLKRFMRGLRKNQGIKKLTELCYDNLKYKLN